ncbi:RHS repeat-associated core domain-containing protein, partial [Pseudomonas sp. HMSC08G10]|uniref:RHS repeat-associated core domain-containing protein n=1 Tax=Pseudomonas sp. HMSC08G10 TaxID=1581141 RepID=UPI00353221BD
TGLYYYGYRYYQSWAGRWLSADPAGTVDGLNLYSMVRNNPVSRLDDQGLADRDPNEDDDGFVLPKGRKQRNQQPKQSKDANTAATAGGSRAEPNYALKDSASTGLRQWVESRNSRVKYEPTEAVGRRLVNVGGKQELRPVFMLTGWIGKDKKGDKSKGEGWRHIRQNHYRDFEVVGFTKDVEIQSIIMKALTEGEIVGQQGKAYGRESARPIYKVEEEGKNHFIAISVSPDGSIIGANPNDEKYIEAGERDDVFPSTRHFYEVVEKERNGPQRMANLIRTAIQKRTSR